MKCWEPRRQAQSLTCEPRPLATDTDYFTKSHFFEVVPCGRPLSWSLAQIPVCQTLTFGSCKESHWHVHIYLQAPLRPQVCGVGFHHLKCVCFPFWLPFSLQAELLSCSDHSPTRHTTLFFFHRTKGETWKCDGERRKGKERLVVFLVQFIWEAVPRAL